MSTSSIPGEPLRDANEAARLNEDLSPSLPPEIAGAVNLLVHPLAGAAAFSALGIGLASHAFGVWMGAVSSAAEMSERLFSSMEAGMRSDSRSFGRHGGSPAQRAASTARALMADAHSASHEPEKASAKVSGSVPARVDARTDSKGKEAVSASAILQPQASPRPATPDDLKVISGIGPKLEKVLNGLGIWTYSQIAGWEKAEIAWMNRHLSFNGRIERDDWIAQARTLIETAGRH